jgi:hypothetical protein
MQLSLPASYARQPQTIAQLTKGGLSNGLYEATYVLPSGEPVSIQQGNKVLGPGQFTRLVSGSFPGIGYGGGPVGGGTGVTSSTANDGLFHRTNVGGPMASSSFASECSLMVIISARTTPSFYDTGPYAATGSFHELQFEIDGTAVGFWARGSSAQQLTRAGTRFTGLNVPHTLIGRRSAVQNFHECFVDGGKVASNTYTNVGSATLLRHGFGGMYTAGVAVCGDTTIYLTAVWGRPLSDGEVAILSANPWAIFDMPSRPILLNSVAAATKAPPPFSRPLRFLRRAS